jgi:hypothetical protein
MSRSRAASLLRRVMHSVAPCRRRASDRSTFDSFLAGHHHPQPRRHATPAVLVLATDHGWRHERERMDRAKLDDSLVFFGRR